MRAVVQRVSEASVMVADDEVARIAHGLCVLVGVQVGDLAADALWLARKVAGARVFRDGAGLMNRDLRESSGALLAVSQFTLLGDLRTGRRPGFSEAMPGAEAQPLFDEFCRASEGLGVPVSRGVFGADMRVRLVNDGPVTLLIDSKKRF